MIFCSLRGNGRGPKFALFLLKLCIICYERRTITLIYFISDMHVCFRNGLLRSSTHLHICFCVINCRILYVVLCRTVVPICVSNDQCVGGICRLWSLGVSNDICYIWGVVWIEADDVGDYTDYGGWASVTSYLYIGVQTIGLEHQ